MVFSVDFIVNLKYTIFVTKKNIRIQDHVYRTIEIFIYEETCKFK